MAQRSVLFLIADDWSRIAGCYGHPVIKTPRIDEFAAQGTLFNYAFCTSPSCAVSRACVLTGHHSHTHGQFGHSHGIHGFTTHNWINSTPGILRENGYATGLIHKSHVEPPSVYPFEIQPKGDSRSPVQLRGAIQEFFNSADDRPFYLHIGYTDPHRMGDGFGNHIDYEGATEVPYSPDDVIVPNFLPDNDATRLDLADYYQAISRFDQCIGVAVDELRAQGRADDTLIVITTDHAMPFPGAKASSFDSGHHCPLIIINPEAGKQGVVCNAMVHWVDFFPTIMEWCGMKDIPPHTHAPSGWKFLPDKRPGRSMMPALEETDPAGWDEVYFSHNFHEVTNYFPYRVIRGRKYKYKQNLASEMQMPFPTDLFRSKTWTAVRERNITMMGDRPTHRLLHHDREELFDIEHDPAESRNLINTPQLQHVAAELRAKVNQFRQDTRDPWLELSFQRGEDVESLD